MSRINVYETDDFGTRSLVGWYDPDTVAQEWDENTEWDGSNRRSLVAGSWTESETLYLTKGGRWVVHHTSRGAGRMPYSRFLTVDEARDWMVRNENSAEEIEKAFGQPLEEERGPGRPAVLGDDVRQVVVRMPAELIERIDAARGDVPRAEWVRALVERSL